MIDMIIPIVLEYPEYDHSWVYKYFREKQVRYADRQGVGSMSRAFNEAVTPLPPSKYIWWITNVKFDKTTIETCVQMMENDPQLAAVHPKFNSDHPHIRYGQGEAPFIEFTAPLIRTEALDDIGLLDEDMPYWGMDLDWSYRARAQGWKLAVAPCELEHTYLRHTPEIHPVTRARKLLKEHYDQPTNDALFAKYGPGWKSILIHNWI